MNCKPGDLAIIVRTGKKTRLLLGRVIKVLKVQQGWPLNGDYSTVDCWTYEPPMFMDGGTPLTFANDCCLRPIRPQADDATDESAAWLPPVPSTEKVAA